jgi:hypothetical protein
MPAVSALVSAPTRLLFVRVVQACRSSLAACCLPIFPASWALGGSDLSFSLHPEAAPGLAILDVSLVGSRYVAKQQVDSEPRGSGGGR